MSKRHLFITILFLLVLIIAYTIEQKLLMSSFPNLELNYIFHFLYSFGICYTLYILSRKEKYNTSIGLFYMATFLLKAVFFFILFGSSIFNEVSLSNKQALSLLLPLFLSLTFEVVFLINMLSKKDTTKND